MKKRANTMEYILDQVCNMEECGKELLRNSIRMCFMAYQKFLERKQNKGEELNYIEQKVIEIINAYVINTIYL